MIIQKDVKINNKTICKDKKNTQSCKSNNTYNSKLKQSSKSNNMYNLSRKQLSDLRLICYLGNSLCIVRNNIRLCKKYYILLDDIIATLESCQTHKLNKHGGKHELTNQRDD